MDNPLLQDIKKFSVKTALDIIKKLAKEDFGDSTGNQNSYCQEW